MPKQITVFTQPGCPPCAQVKEFLTRNGFAFIERDIRTDPTAVEELRQIGAMMTPVTLIDGEVIMGFDEFRLRDSVGLSQARAA